MCECSGWFRVDGEAPNFYAGRIVVARVSGTRILLIGLCCGEEHKTKALEKTRFYSYSKPWNGANHVLTGSPVIKILLVGMIASKKKHIFLAISLRRKFAEQNRFLTD